MDVDTLYIMASHVFRADLDLLKRVGVPESMRELLQGDANCRTNPRGPLPCGEGLVGLAAINDACDHPEDIICGCHVMAPMGTTTSPWDRWCIPMASSGTNNSGLGAQARYSARFASMSPEIARVLRGELGKRNSDPRFNVYVAGGSAAYVVSPSEHAFNGDFDIYITCGSGLSEEGPFREGEWWAKVAEIADAIRREYKTGGQGIIRTESIVEVVKRGCVSFTITRTTQDRKVETLRVEIILRAYDCLSRLLHGFDIAAASVAYDGERTYLTKMSAWSHAHRGIFIIPECSSPSYCHRLQKYHGRGFALVIPAFLGPFVESRTVDLPCGLSLTPKEVVHGRVCYGEVICRAPPISDYAGGEALGDDVCRNNIELFAARNTVTITSYTETRYPAHMPENQGTPFHEYADEGVPSLRTVLPPHIYRGGIEALAKVAVTRKGVDIYLLSRVFKLDRRQISMVASAAIDALEKDAGCQIDISESLHPMVEAMVARYDKTPERLEFWISENPSSQHTGSLNPQPESLKEFLGKYFCGREPLPGDTPMTIPLQLLLRRSETLRTYNDECVLCGESIEGWQPNVVTFGCRHAYHFATTPRGECRGVIGMIEVLIQEGSRLNGLQCPICRTSVSAGPPQRPATTPPNAVAVTRINIDLLQGAEDF